MIFVDHPSWPGRGRLWSHLVSDVSFAELHVFAESLGAPRRGFDRDHYDIPAEHYLLALWLGAHPATSREIVAMLLCQRDSAAPNIGVRAASGHATGPASSGLTSRATRNEQANAREGGASSRPWRRASGCEHQNYGASARVIALRERSECQDYRAGCSARVSCWPGRCPPSGRAAWACGTDAAD